MAEVIKHSIPEAIVRRNEKVEEIERELFNKETKVGRKHTVCRRPHGSW